MKNDGLDDYRKEYNDMLLSKASGGSGIMQDTAIKLADGTTISLTKSDRDAVMDKTVYTVSITLSDVSQKTAIGNLSYTITGATINGSLTGGAADYNALTSYTGKIHLIVFSGFSAYSMTVLSFDLTAQIEVTAIINHLASGRKHLVSSSA